VKLGGGADKTLRPSRLLGAGGGCLRCRALKYLDAGAELLGRDLALNSRPRK
jgi:hypothetical protein